MRLIMLESYMKQITNCINSLSSYLRENQEEKRQNYCEKLEQTLELVIKFFKKYDALNNHSFRCQNIGIDLLMNPEREVRWEINTQNKTEGFKKSMTTKELVNYCWDNKMDVKSLITNLFSYINQILSKKKQRMSNEIDRYNSEINCLNEAIDNLNELIEMDIPEEIKQR